MPKRLGRYLIERSIGSGAFAEVYLADYEVLGRQVAQKVLKLQLLADREALERFIQEARVLDCWLLNLWGSGSIAPSG
jgi:eukaryotic-like serine/threonine-protein kinase